MNLEAKIKEKAAEFCNLSEEDCITLVLVARSLSLEECFDYLLIDRTTLTETENRFCELLHRRGRAIGVKDATDKLFLHMATRNGGQSALEYLKQFSGDFSVEVQGGQSGGGFQFNVTIPEPQVKREAKVSTGN